MAAAAVGAYVTIIGGQGNFAHPADHTPWPTAVFIPLYGSAPEGAGPVVQAPGRPDAEAVGGALALPPDHYLQVVHVLDQPGELLRLHQVEGDAAAHQLPLWDDALGDVSEYSRLHEAGLDAVPVQGLLGQGEMVRVPGQSVLLVQGEISPSSKAPRAAVSQARMRSLLASPWPRSVCLMVRARSWRYPSPSWNVEGPLGDIPFYSIHPRACGVCG